MRSLLPAIPFLFLLSACQAPSPATQPSPTIAEPAPAHTAIRIDAGSKTSYKDSAGNLWLPDMGFKDGELINRGPDIKIYATPDPDLYRTEHVGMSSFACPIPNGRYILKLHFAETAEAITAKGQRIFCISTMFHEILDLDIWARAGGKQKALIESFPLEVTNGILSITFIPYVQAPVIDAIEILPDNSLAAPEVIDDFSFSAETLASCSFDEIRDAETVSFDDLIDKDCQVVLTRMQELPKLTTLQFFHCDLAKCDEKDPVPAKVCAVLVAESKVSQGTLRWLAKFPSGTTLVFGGCDLKGLEFNTGKFTGLTFDNCQMSRSAVVKLVDKLMQVTFKEVTLVDDK